MTLSLLVWWSEATSFQLFCSFFNAKPAPRQVPLVWGKPSSGQQFLRGWAAGRSRTASTTSLLFFVCFKCSHLFHSWRLVLITLEGQLISFQLWNIFGWGGQFVTFGKFEVKFYNMCQRLRDSGEASCGISFCFRTCQLSSKARRLDCRLLCQSIFVYRKPKIAVCVKIIAGCLKKKIIHQQTFSSRLLIHLYLIQVQSL